MLALAVAVALLAIAAGASAAAEVGSIGYRGCLRTASGPVSSICTLLPGAALNQVKDVAVSPDGRNVYAVADDAAAVVSFARDASGGLGLIGCLSSDSDRAECGLLPGAVPGAEGTPLASAATLAISPDGRSVYVTSADEALVRFGREPATGALGYADCVSGRSGSLCAHLPGSTSDADGTGLSSAREPVLGADGTNLYVLARGSDAISRFGRDPSSGAIAYLGCIGGNTAAACTHIPGATNGGTGTGLDAPTDIVLSLDGTSLYAISAANDSVAHFRVAPGGELSYAGCVSSDSDVAGCAALPGASPGGIGTAANRATSLTISPDGRQVYLAGRDDSVVGFDRDLATGTLADSHCITGNPEVSGCAPLPDSGANGEESGLDGPRKIIASADGNDVYVAAEYESAVVRFRRDAAGALAFAGCHTGDQGSTACSSVPAPSAQASGLASLESLALSTDGRSLYTSASLTDSVSHFKREVPLDLPPTPLDPTATPPPTSPAAVTVADRCAAPRLRRLEAVARGNAKRPPAVRLRVKLSGPGQVKVVRATLTRRGPGAKRTIALRPASARAARAATLRLRLPRKASIPRGALVRVRAMLRIRAADPSCRPGPKRWVQRRAKVI